MTKAQKQREKALIAWVKLIAQYERENPGKDWLQEMGTADVEDNEGGGSNPKNPPPPPPFP